MEHLLDPYSKKIESCTWWEGAFTEEQLNWLQGEAKKAVVSAGVGGRTKNNNDNPEIRRSKINWLSNNENNSWVFKELANVVSKLNADFFGFNLTGFGEKLQLTHYNESDQGMYTWHQDFGSTGPSRKLSLVLQLSEPDEYEGGELQLLNAKTPTCIKKKRGLITVFPAWTLHQVTPVIKGNRQTLVAWVSGPPFK